jgi:hypothetical protein
MNDSRLTLIPERFIALKDNNTNEVQMRVSFDVDGNNVVCMTTSKDLTYVSAGKETSVSAGGKVFFPVNHVVILITGSAYTPRMEVRLVKKDAPRDPTPPPAQVQKRQKRQKRQPFYMVA